MQKDTDTEYTQRGADENPRSDLKSIPLDQLQEEAKQCIKCDLSKTCNNVVFGDGPGNATIMVVGEAPGAFEDETGSPFVGKAGDLLTKWLESVGLPRHRIYITNVVKCRPPENRLPTSKEIDLCGQYLKEQISAIRPKVILAMGRVACDFLIPTCGRPMAEIRGSVYAYEENIPVVPTYHPAYILRNPAAQSEVDKDLLLFKRVCDSMSGKSGLQIRVGPSKSIIYRCPDNLLNDLFEEFTYTNSSVSYQLHKHCSGRSNVIRQYMVTQAMNETDAAALWKDEKDNLQRLLNPCLLKPTKDGLIVFPTGLLSRLLGFFAGHGVVTDRAVVDMRKKPTSTTGFPISRPPANLRPYQQDALQALIKAGQGTAVAGTGTGKTVVIQELIRSLGLKVVIVVPSLSILGQTERRLRDYFGRGMVGSYSGKKKKQKSITVACAPSLASSDPAEWADRDVLIFDEAHHCPCDTIEQIAYRVMPNAFYRFGFTATYHRTDGADLAIEAAVFPPVHTYTVEKGIEEGFLARPRFLMFSVGFCSYKKYTGKMPVYAYKNHVIRNTALNEKIIRHVQLFLESGKKILVLVREKSHGHMLQKQISGSVFVRNKGSESGERYIAPYVDPEKAVDQFNKGEIQCLIGTSIIGEGTDIIPVDVLFNLMGGSSKVTVMQNIGRALRPAPGKEVVWIIDYIHRTNDMLEKHSMKRYNIYKKVGQVDILELERVCPPTN